LDAERSSQPGPAKYTFFRDYCVAHLKPDEETRVYDEWIAVIGYLSDVYEQHKEAAVTEALKSYNYPLVIYYMEEASLSEEEVDAVWDVLVEPLERPDGQDFLHRFFRSELKQYQKVTFLGELGAVKQENMAMEDLQDKFWPICRAPATVQKMAELAARPFIGYHDAVWFMLDFALREVLWDNYRSDSPEEFNSFITLVYNWFTSEEFAARHPHFNFLYQAPVTDWWNVEGMYTDYPAVEFGRVIIDCFNLSVREGQLRKLG